MKALALGPLLLSVSLFAAAPQDSRWPKEPTCSQAEVEKQQTQEIAAEDEGNPDAAIEIADKILALCPTDYRSMNVKAGLFGKTGRFEEELKWADKSIAIKKDFWASHVNRGNALAALRRRKQAKTEFMKAHQIDPKVPHPLYSLGVYEENQGNYKAALQFYEKAIQIDPKFLYAQFNRAAMLANLKRTPEAKQALYRLLKLTAKTPDEIATLNDAKAMLSTIEERERASTNQ